jgi:hypothetical protein
MALTMSAKWMSLSTASCSYIDSTKQHGIVDSPAVRSCTVFVGYEEEILSNKDLRNTGTFFLASFGVFGMHSFCVGTFQLRRIPGKTL